MGDFLKSGQILRILVVGAVFSQKSDTVARTEIDFSCYRVFFPHDNRWDKQLRKNNNKTDILIEKRCTLGTRRPFGPILPSIHFSLAKWNLAHPADFSSNPMHSGPGHWPFFDPFLSIFGPISYCFPRETVRNRPKTAFFGQKWPKMTKKGSKMAKIRARNAWK